MRRWGLCCIRCLPTSLRAADEASPDLNQLNAGLQREFEKTIVADPEALRRVPFELYFAAVTKDGVTGGFNLVVNVELDPSFGGQTFRLAARHAGTQDESRQQVSKIALDGGVADLLVSLGRISAKFPKISVVQAICTYSGTESYLDTESHTFTQIVLENREILQPGGGTKWGLVLKPVQRTTEWTTVKDRDVEKGIAFIVPAGKIPDTTNKKTASDAILAAGEVIILDSK